MKIVILGARRQLEPLEILYMPRTNPNGLEAAQAECHGAIDEADDIWVLLPGMGDHTIQDFLYARAQGKRISVIVEIEEWKKNTLRMKLCPNCGAPFIKKSLPVTGGTGYVCNNEDCLALMVIPPG